MSSEGPEQPRRPVWTPVGDAPAAPAPASAPLTPEPVTPEPVTPELVTPGPVTPDATTPAPWSPDPVAPEPMTPEPIDADDFDADIIRPVAAPPAEETFPAFEGFPTPSVTPYGSGDPDPDFDVPDEPDPDTDPVRALGQSAVTNASFSAAGAHTPMGGVPLPRATFMPDTPDGAAPNSPLTGVDDQTQESEFVPTFAAREPVFSGGQPTVSFASLTPPEFEDTEFEEPETASVPHHASSGHVGDEPWWRSVAALVVYGVIVMAGLAYAVYVLAIAPAPVTLAADVLLEGPPDNGIEPIEVAEPTPFLAGAPLKTPTHTLTAVESYSIGDLENPPGRVAEVHDLTYFDGSTTYMVRAYQHYNVDDAVETFGVLAADAASVVPVEVAGEQVGERAELATDAGTVIVWSNATAVFELTGPEDGILEFFTLFGW